MILAVAVVLEHGGGGSSKAAPVSKAVIEVWLDQEVGRQPDEEDVLTKERLEQQCRCYKRAVDYYKNLLDSCSLPSITP